MRGLCCGLDGLSPLIAIDGAEFCREDGGGARLPTFTGGGGGFRAGCGGKGFLGIAGGGIEEDVPEAGEFAESGGASFRVPANKLKSPKSRMVALAADPDKSESPGASGGDDDTCESFSWIAGLLWFADGTAIPAGLSSSTGSV